MAMVASLGCAAHLLPFGLLFLVVRVGAGKHSTIGHHQVHRLDRCQEFHGDDAHKDSWLRPLDCSTTDVSACSTDAASGACLFVTSDVPLKRAAKQSRLPEWASLVMADVKEDAKGLIEWSALAAMPYAPFLESSKECPECCWVLLYDSVAAQAVGFPKGNLGITHCGADLCEIDIPTANW